MIRPEVRKGLSCLQFLRGGTMNELYYGRKEAVREMDSGFEDDRG